MILITIFHYETKKQKDGNKIAKSKNKISAIIDHANWLHKTNIVLDLTFFFFPSLSLSFPELSLPVAFIRRKKRVEMEVLFVDGSGKFSYRSNGLYMFGFVAQKS